VAAAAASPVFFSDLEYGAELCVGLHLLRQWNPEWEIELMEMSFVLIIVALLPLTGGLLVLQRDPYRALIIRGILGAIASLTYALLGAADVALTEALVGTLLAITLYAVAVRSSMNMRVGGLESEVSLPVFAALRTCLSAHYIRCEPIAYQTIEVLEKALLEREIHAIYLPANQRLTTRVSAFYKILSADMPSDVATVTYLDLASDRLPDEGSASATIIQSGEATS